MIIGKRLSTLLTNEGVFHADVTSAARCAGVPEVEQATIAGQGA